VLILREQESNARSLVKGVSWRVVGSVDTFLLSWLFSHSPGVAVKIAGAETITKILIYFFHERAWQRVRWGISTVQVEERVVSPAVPDATRDADR
jgi:uncharacterized membrane protein